MLFGKKESTESIRICPLFVGGQRIPVLKVDRFKELQCLKNECMWWNSEEQDCNINVIAKRLPMLQEILK
jgi:hypothetical protein